MLCRLATWLPMAASTVHLSVPQWLKPVVGPSSASQTAVRAVSAALSSHDGDTLAAAPAALQLNGEGADDMRHSNMHMSGFDALLMQCAKRNSGAALVRC